MLWTVATELVLLCFGGVVVELDLRLVGVLELLRWFFLMGVAALGLRLMGVLELLRWFCLVDVIVLGLLLVGVVALGLRPACVRRARRSMAARVLFILSDRARLS